MITAEGAEGQGPPGRRGQFERAANANASAAWDISTARTVEGRHTPSAMQHCAAARTGRTAIRAQRRDCAKRTEKAPTTQRASALALLADQAALIECRRQRPVLSPHVDLSRCVPQPWKDPIFGSCKEGRTPDALEPAFLLGTWGIQLSDRTTRTRLAIRQAPREQHPLQSQICDRAPRRFGAYRRRSNGVMTRHPTLEPGRTCLGQTPDATMVATGRALREFLYPSGTSARTHQGKRLVRRASRATS
jgi:hypothetical protein